MILDTCALSDLAGAHPDLLAAIQGHDVIIPFIAAAEYLSGVRRSRHQKRLEAWLEALLGRWPPLCADRRTLDHYAALHAALREAGNPIPTNDLWIAALARQHGLPVLTRDRHFTAVPGISVVSWGDG